MARLVRELNLQQDFAVLTMVVLAATGIAIGPGVVAVAERCITATRPRLRLLRVAVPAAVSTVCAALFSAGWARFGASPVMAAWCWICMTSCALRITDLRARRLPFPIA